MKNMSIKGDIKHLRKIINNDYTSNYAKDNETGARK